MPDADTLGWLIASVTIMFVIWMGLRAEARKDKGRLKTREERMLEEINGLKETVQTLLIKLNESQREIDSLEVRLKAALARITEVEIMYEITPGQPVTRLSPKRKLVRPLLVVCGPNTAIVGADLAVLDAIGLRYTRLLNATQTDVADAIGNARDDGRMYRWLLISANAGPQGVMLADGIAPADFWMRQVVGFEVVGIAACKGTNIADHLRDRVSFVWYFRENVPNDHANRFVQKFFQRLCSGEEPEGAFIACLDAVPEVASFAEYRSR